MILPRAGVISAIVLLTFLFAACGSDAQSDPGVFFPTHESKDAPSSQAFGVLLQKDDCVFVHSEQSDDLLPIWPKGYSFRDGVLYDADGTSKASSGDAIELGGGEVDVSVAIDLIGTNIPDRCSGAIPFLVSDVSNTPSHN